MLYKKVTPKQMIFSPVRVFVYISHSLIFFGCFLPDTKVRIELEKYNFVPLVVFLIFYITFMWFYYKTSVADTFVKQDDAPLNTDEDLFFCEQCNHYCPLRASHCKHCKKCVLRRDHHCNFLDTCIGMGNHFYFLCFLFFLLLFDITAINLFKVGMKDGQPFIKWLVTTMPCNICLFGSIASIIQPAILFPIHFFLALTNNTTWEFVKGSTITYFRGWHIHLSPFSKGLIGNLKEFCTMHKNHPTYFIPRTPEELEKYKADNSFISNDTYDCC